jgi:hypothetical protein
MLLPHTTTLVVYENCQFPMSDFRFSIEKKILNSNSQIGNQNTTSFLQKPKTT